MSVSGAWARVVTVVTVSMAAGNEAAGTGADAETGAGVWGLGLRIAIGPGGH